MGQAIVYCSYCQSQLRTADFDRGAAFRVDTVIVCSKCSPKAFKGPVPQRGEVLLPAEELRPTTPRPGHSNTQRHSTGAIPVIHGAEELPPTTPRPRLSNPQRHSTGAIPVIHTPINEEKENRNLVLVLSGVGILGLGLLALIFAGGSSRGGRTTPSERSSGLPIEATMPHGPGPAPAPTEPIPSSANTAKSSKEKESLARASLEKARDYDRRLPEDLMGQEPLFEQARWDARGTPVEEEATKAFEALQKKWKDRLEAEGTALGASLSPALTRQDFKEVLRALDEASGRSPRAAWKDIISRKRQEIDARMGEAYAPLRAKALEAKGRRALQEVGAIRERVGQWGVKALLDDLENALAERPAPPPPAPVISPEVAIYEKTWRRAMTLVSGRAHTQAVKELEGALQDLKDPAVRSEAIRDIDMAKQLATVTPEALGVIARWPKGSKIHLDYWDEGGQPRSVDGVMQRADLLEIEVRRDKDVVWVPTGEIQPRTIAELFRTRAAGRSPSDESVLGCFLLGEGEAALVKDPPAGQEAPAPKFRQWAQDFPGILQAPDRAKREGDARGLFYGAERDRATCVGEADAVAKCKALLKDFADTAFVTRNQALIHRRGLLGRDFPFLTEDMSGAGTFKLESSKSGSSWASGTAADPAVRKSSFVELQFSVCEDLSYRCWVYVGGCCAETLAFSVQGSELKAAVSSAGASGPAVDFGGAAAIPIKHSIGNSVRSHASHATGKRTLFWGWVEVPLPKYSQPGKKMLRILAEHPGLLVRYGVVSSSRLVAPSEGEMRDIEKARNTLALATGRLVGNFIRDPGYELCTPGQPQTLRPPWYGEGPAAMGAEKENGRNHSICSYIYAPDKASTAWSAVIQKIAVAPQTNYELSVWVQTCPGLTGGACGARTQAGVVLGQKPVGASDGYTEYRIPFNSGPNSSVTVFAGFANPSGMNGWIHIDDWSLVEK